MDCFQRVPPPGARPFGLGLRLSVLRPRTGSLPDGPLGVEPPCRSGQAVHPRRWASRLQMKHCRRSRHAASSASVLRHHVGHLW